MYKKKTNEKVGMNIRTNYHKWFSMYADVFLLVLFFHGYWSSKIATLKTRYKFSHVMYENDTRIFFHT